MKNKNNFFLLPLLVFLSACSTTQHSEKKVIEEAKLETPSRDSDVTRAKILEILNQDASVVESERKAIVSLIDESFGRYQELELLANQKKTLLIREYMKKNPNRNKIHSIQLAIRKAYSNRTDIVMDFFDNIAKALNVHPISANMFFDRASSFWPMRDRAL